MPFFSARPTSIFGIRRRGLLPFLFRQIITTGYVAAGYRNTVTWRNVNSISFATDVSSNHGDLLQSGSSYMAAAHNRNKMFVFSTNVSGTQGWGAFTNTSCFNMRNNTTLTKTAAMDTPNAVGHSQQLHQTDLDGNNTMAYYTGANGSNVIRRFNTVTETSDNAYGLSTSYPNLAAASWTGEGSTGLQDELFGVWFNGTSRLRFTFATETQASVSASYGASSQQRGTMTKLGFGYAGNEGSYNNGFNFRKTNLITDAQVSVMAKPIGDSGEENFIMGQSHTLMLGMYGAPGPTQSNRSWRWNYATDSGFEGGASMQPTGTATGVGVGGSNHPESTIQGRSSASMAYRD